jgi:nicotinate-nucleotide adenylyltransferase
MTQLAISATQIRALLASGSSPRYLLPDAVIAYIRQAPPLPGELTRQ